MLRDRHKTLRKSAILLTGTVLAVPAQASGQVPDPVPSATIRATVPSGVAALLLGTPGLQEWSAVAAQAGARCDPARVPGFDRWAIRPTRTGWEWASDIGLLALAGLVVIDIARRDDGARTLEALAAGGITFGVTELIKVAVGRPRPDRYLPGRAGTPDVPCRGRSFPSGHTSVAFTFATTYWLARRDLEGEPGVLGWMGYGVAAGVGVSRVAAGRHFPSDVLAGAALGTVSGVVAYKVRF
jgi:membrane-associated phospholipid phosphatase